MAVAAALIGYPLSFGPACWLAAQNETVRESIHLVYHPILWATHSARSEMAPGMPEEGWLNSCVHWYATIGRDDDCYPTIARDGQSFWYCN